MHKKISTYALSYFADEKLRTIFLESDGAAYRVVDSQFLSLTQAESSPEVLSDFRKKIMNFRSKNPFWIHIIARNSCLVKVFTVPKVAPQELEHAVSKRIQAEIPYVSEEVILHQVIQEASEGKESQVLLFGVSKAALNDQSKKLEALGIIPDKVVLSTEVLAWMYRSEIIPKEKPQPVSLLIHSFADQLEVLFFEDHVLLHSRWISLENENATAVRDELNAAIMGFQREWHKKPDDLIIVGNAKELGTFAVDPSFNVKHIFSEAHEIVTPLILATLAAHKLEEINDYSLVEHKEVRQEKTRTENQSKLAFSIACFAFSLFLLAAFQITLILGEIGWLNYKINSFSKSVKEIKKQRTQAKQVSAYYDQKAMPIILISSLRDVIPNNVLLSDLQYLYQGRSVTIRGTAPAQTEVDAFVNQLEKNALFQHMKLKGVQSSKDARGQNVLEFSLEGNLKQGEL